VVVRRGMLGRLPIAVVTIRCLRAVTTEARARRPSERVDRWVLRRAPGLLWRCRSRERGVQCTPCRSIRCGRHYRRGGTLVHHRAVHEAIQRGSTSSSATRRRDRRETHRGRRCVEVQAGRAPVSRRMRCTAALRRQDDRGSVSATRRLAPNGSIRAPGLARRCLLPTLRPCSHDPARVPLQQSYRKARGTVRRRCRARSADRGARRAGARRDNLGAWVGAAPRRAEVACRLPDIGDVTRGG
jgi:hypothetical protein